MEKTTPANPFPAMQVTKYVRLKRITVRRTDHLAAHPIIGTIDVSGVGRM